MYYCFKLPAVVGEVAQQAECERNIFDDCIGLTHNVFIVFYVFLPNNSKIPYAPEHNKKKRINIIL